MTPKESARLGNLLATKRKERGFSVPEVSRRAGIDRGTLWRIEKGVIGNPKAENLQSIGAVIGIPASDLFAIVGWVPSKQLPTIRPYLRTKYHQLPDAAVIELEDHFDVVARRHGISFDSDHGPQNREDE